MKVLVYSCKAFERPLLEAASSGFDVTYTAAALHADSIVLATGYDAISVFTNDDVSSQIVVGLHRVGVRFIAIRAAGYDHVDLNRVNDLGMHCANVPAYSPYAVAEHAVALMLALNRKIVTAHQQVAQFNFTVGNLIGFDMKGKTVGIVATGKIGSVVAHILHGFGCRLLGFDVTPDQTLVEKLGLIYTSLELVFSQADIITIHLPLNEKTHHLIDKKLLSKMKPGAMLINTARGAVIKTADLLPLLENGRIGALGLDVYEHEKGLFFFDHAHDGTKDDLLKSLIAFPQVLITPHQGFATYEALQNIAETTFANLSSWAAGQPAVHEIGITTQFIK